MEGFGLHAEEAALLGRIVITLDAPPFNERFNVPMTQVMNPKKKAMKNVLGSRYVTTAEALKDVIVKFIRANVWNLIGRRFHLEAMERGREFRGRFLNSYRRQVQ
jgi:hypothetical protein